MMSQYEPRKDTSAEVVVPGAVRSMTPRMIPVIPWSQKSHQMLVCCGCEAAIVTSSAGICDDATRWGCVIAAPCRRCHDGSFASAANEHLVALLAPGDDRDHSRRHAPYGSRHNNLSTGVFPRLVLAHHGDIGAGARVRGSIRPLVVVACYRHHGNPGWNICGKTPAACRAHYADGDRHRPWRAWADHGHHGDRRRLYGRRDRVVHPGGDLYADWAVPAWLAHRGGAGGAPGIRRASSRTRCSPHRICIPRPNLIWATLSLDEQPGKPQAGKSPVRPLLNHCSDRFART